MALPRALRSWLAPSMETRQRRRRLANGHRLALEPLESRVVPSSLPAPDPIDPTRGQTNLLRVVQMMSDKQNLNAQDHFPVPYTVIVSAGAAAPTIKNWLAGAPLKLDADQSMATGQGGNDIQVEVNTDRYTNALGKPDWKLRLNVNRVGTAPFAQNLSVTIAFPWNAFDTNNETLPALPNIMMGFQTRLPGIPGQLSYINGLDGGIAPLSMQMVVTPHILAGTTHAFEWAIDTTGAANPLTFLAGEFDGNPGSNTIVNALGWSAYVQNVPDHIGTELKVAENAIGSPAVDSKMDLHWTASARSLTTFDYLEAESNGAASLPQTADYATQIVADKMPTDERFVLRQDEAGGALTLAHDGNASIHEMTFLKRRSDGLSLTGVASDENSAVDAIPTHVAMTLGLKGSASLNVTPGSKADLFVQGTQVGGFNNTSQFFEKYNLEYVALKVKNSPNITVQFDETSTVVDGAERSFAVSVTNAGEVAPFTEMTLDDNGRISATNAPLNLELPERYGSSPSWNLWSIVDDGTHGTVVARALDITRKATGPFTGSALFDHKAKTIIERVEFQTVAAHPMQVYVKSGLLSAVQPPVPAGKTSPDPYIEITGHIEDVPIGRTFVAFDFPLKFQWKNDEGNRIGVLCMAGHIGTFNFATILEDVPSTGSSEFRPEGSIVVVAQDNFGNPDFFSLDAAIAYDVTGFDKNVIEWPENYSLNGFHSENKTFFPNSTPLKETRVRLDHVPSMRATWDNNSQHTYIDIATDAATGLFSYVGGVQLQISTVTALGGTVLTCDNVKDFLPPAATPQSEHYALLKDVAGEQTLKFGVFGVHSFHFASDDTTTPSSYILDFLLDPSRPYTAAHINVDTHPTSTGALGTFFGGSTVTGPLDISYVPSHLNIASNFDPGFCTDGTFPGTGLPPLPFPLPAPSDIDQNFTVDGTNIFIHAHNLAPKMCLNFDVTGPTSTLTLTSTDASGVNVVKTGLVEILFQNTTANGLDSGALFGAGNAIHEARLRFDDVPSVAVSWSTGAPTPFFDVNTTAADDPSTLGVREDILGGFRMDADVVAHSPVLPTYNPLTGTESQFFQMIDDSTQKKFAGQIVGLDHFRVSVPTTQIQMTYTGNVSRDLTVQVKSIGGKLSQNYDIDAGLLISPLPQTFTLTANLNGQAVTTDGSTGITKLRLGKSDVSAFVLNDGVFDKHADPSNIAFTIDMTGLPAKFGFTVNPGQSGGATISAQTAGGSPSSAGSIVARIQDDAGFGGAGLLGTPPIRDVRLRLDSIPTMTASWASGVGGTNIDVSTAASSGPFQYLGGVQVILSTVRDTAAFTAPVGGASQTLMYGDAGGVDKKYVSLQVYGLDEFHFATTNSPQSISLGYAADTARALVVDVDARFGNKFFPDNDVNATLTVTNIPKTWTFSTDFATKLDVTASGGSVEKIEVLGDIGTKSGSNVYMTNVNARVTGIPGLVHFLVVPQDEGLAELTLSNPITEVFVELKSDTKIFGGDYKYILASVNAIPAKWKATWGLSPDPHAALTADAPLGPVSIILSKKVASEVPGEYAVFQSAGGDVQYTDYAREIDKRYFRQGQGNADDREATFMTRLDALYHTTSKLGANEDHFIVRKDDAGKTEFTSIRGTGFQGLSASLADSTLTASVTINFPGNHPFFIGLEQYRPDAAAIAAGNVGKFLTVDIENIPDTTTVTIGPNKAYVDFSSSPGRILVYKGPLPGATDGQDALKVLVNAGPSFIHVDWNFSLNGGVTLTTDQPFEVAVLTQSASSRIVADFTFQNLAVTWGFDTLVIDFETELLPPAEWIVFKFVKASLDISASPGVDGFLQVYDFIHNAQDLEGGSTFHSPNQYVPAFSVLAKDLTGIFHLEAGIKVYLVGLGIPGGHIPGVPVFYVDANVGALSAIDLDWWDKGGGVFNFLGGPDYIDNDPWDLWPLAHSQGSHLYPFGPLPPMLAAGPAPAAATGPAITNELLAPLWVEAARRWAAAGATPDQVARALATTPTIRNLGGLYLGTTVGGQVSIDDNAAGYGWFVDPTPAANEEFGSTGNGAATGRMDLLTVLSHEMGRQFGFDVVDAGQHEVMSLTLTPGTRLADGAPQLLATAIVSGVPAVSSPASVPQPTIATAVLSSAALFAPDLGWLAATAAGDTRTPIVARFDPEQEYPLPVGENSLFNAAPQSGIGGMLATYTQRPSGAASEEDFTPLWVG